MKLYNQSDFESVSFLSPLCEIADVPKKIFVRGTLPEITDGVKVLTVVGSRKYTSYGRDVCEKLVQGLAGTNTIIVSGLALGIDSIAHKAALDAGLATVAVLGNGLSDKCIYPKQHLALAREIIDAGGALISEYEPDTEARSYTFPARNRIAVGVSHAVLVIEAEEKSGTLITARLATEYNRDVLTVPGSIFSDSSRGPHMLLRLGATPITSVDDLREALGYTSSGDGVRTQNTLPLDLTNQERVLLDILYEPKTKDTLLAESNLSTGEALIHLSMLEIKGLVKEEMGVVRRC